MICVAPAARSASVTSTHSLDVSPPTESTSSPGSIPAAFAGDGGSALVHPAAVVTGTQSATSAIVVVGFGSPSTANTKKSKPKPITKCMNEPAASTMARRPGGWR